MHGGKQRTCVLLMVTHLVGAPRGAMRCLAGWEAEETLERGKVLTPPSDTTNRCTALDSGSEWKPSPVTESREMGAAWEVWEDEEDGGGGVLSEGNGFC